MVGQEEPQTDSQVPALLSKILLALQRIAGGEPISLVETRS
jgi:hypothetical protein